MKNEVEMLSLLDMKSSRKLVAIQCLHVFVPTWLSIGTSNYS